VHILKVYAEENVRPTGAKREQQGGKEPREGGRGQRERQGISNRRGLANSRKEKRKKDERRKKKGRKAVETEVIGNLDAEKHGVREYSETGRRLSIQLARGYDSLEQFNRRKTSQLRKDKLRSMERIVLPLRSVRMEGFA